MGERVVVAMSGGVDSSVAALLLKEAGCEPIGLFLRNGVSAPKGEGARPGRQGCCSVEDAQDARRVAVRLGIPFYALDYRERFERLIESFVASYQRGETPSPCVLCNQWLKFGSLLEFARDIGAAGVATGHYARTERRPDGRTALLRAKDGAKDQSYFLASLSQEQLAACRFPLGDLSKPEVREIARRAGLPTAEKPESMEICFVPGGDYRRLLEERAPGSLRPGPIVDERGRTVGEHAGFQTVTIGQRRGLGLALGVPAYVTEIDPARNLVRIGPRAALGRRSLCAERTTWVSREAPRAGEEIRCEAQVRHRHRAAPAVARALDRGGERIEVRFDEPVEAVAPGQAVVLYAGDEVIAGGWIGQFSDRRATAVRDPRGSSDESNPFDCR
jgi:tRNA-specific 2-thiouridylase